MERPLEERDVTPKAIRWLITVLFICGLAALAVSLAPGTGDPFASRVLGFGALLAANLLRSVFTMEAARRNRQADKQRARTMTAVQRESSGLSGL